MFAPEPIKSRGTEELNREQLNEKISNELVTMFEKDIHTFFEFVEHINFYEENVVNDYSKDKEKIPMAKWLDLSEEMIMKGFTQRVSLAAVKKIDGMCQYSVNRLAPVLSEMTKKLDNINQLYSERYIEANKILNEFRELQIASQQLIIENEKLSAQIAEQQIVTNEAYELLKKVVDNTDVSMFLNKKQVAVIKEYEVPVEIVPESETETETQTNSESPQKVKKKGYPFFQKR